MNWKSGSLIALFIFTIELYICNCEQQIIDSLEILEALSQIALLRHHPPSAFSNANNVTEGFASFLEDLHRQNFTEEHSSLNCSSLTPFPLLPKNLCNDGNNFKVISLFHIVIVYGKLYTTVNCDF